MAGHYSRQVVVSDHTHHVLYAHVIVAERDGETTRAIVLSQRRDGVHNLRFQEAWSHGVELPFRRGGALDGCSHGHCLNRHAGLIFLPAPLFAHAQRHGLAVRLLSGTENIDISVPAHLFRLTTA
ncbi:hypothetical protein [Gymnodinialimonas ceratoperidinii]|uniref:Uncharacterized protein n=1 Tax=Gymnodinialimonas ceratoperidinii TaxID=2856823 RepID=A0A8F6TWF1_9RHOB|nr:hypothetical protein [Gymnodinialimonas ceratoperidinii]QXT39164.1 hypothetical protein KYE46_14720 [Gymnodinialimonas ceratoperidinii]